jgi:hypothetical protein
MSPARMTPVGWLRRAAGLLCATTVLVGLQVAAPASACACGGAAPPIDGGEVNVDREIAMVRWVDRAGGTEEIVMQLAMSATTGETGLVVPTPHPAAVTLGDAQLFDDLVESIEPETIVEWDWWGSPGFGGVTGAPDGGGAPVILSQVQLGPIEATTLQADDAAGLEAWLDENGYALPTAVSDRLEPYVADGWSFVALRLTSDAPFDGALDPIRFTFASDELVYPMRMSAAATTSQTVRLYLPADHRMEITLGADAISPRVVWAGPTSHPSVTELGPFLTVVELEFFDPSAQITDDLRIDRAADDGTIGTTRVETRVLAVAGIPVGWLMVLGSVLLFIAIVAVLAILLGRRAMRAMPASTGGGSTTG